MPWWFQTGLTTNLLTGQDVKPIVNEAVGKPDARINGQQVANWPP